MVVCQDCGEWVSSRCPRCQCCEECCVCPLEPDDLVGGDPDSMEDDDQPYFWNR